MGDHEKDMTGKLNPNNPLVYLPHELRKPFYGLYALTGIILGSIDIGSDATWVDTALKIFAYIGIATGATAASNTLSHGKPQRKKNNG